MDILQEYVVRTTLANAAIHGRGDMVFHTYEEAAAYRDRFLASGKGSAVITVRPRSAYVTPSDTSFPLNVDWSLPLAVNRRTLPSKKVRR